MTYLEKEKASGIKVGDKVKVISIALDYEGGWGLCWCDAMDFYVGKEGVVEEISEIGEGIRISFDEYADMCFYFFPYFCLEKIEEEKIDLSGSWNATCQRCGAPAYQGLFKVECSKGCK